MVKTYRYSLRGGVTFFVIGFYCKDLNEILRGVYPEPSYKIPRFARNDRRRAQNDTLCQSIRLRLAMTIVGGEKLQGGNVKSFMKKCFKTY